MFVTFYKKLAFFFFNQEALLNSTWGMLNNKTKLDLESQLNCCGLLNVTKSQQQFDQDLQNCPAVSFRYQIFHCYIPHDRKTLFLNRKPT